MSREARRLIQAAYDRLVDHWGNDGSTLQADRDYQPELNLIRDMFRWLARPADACLICGQKRNDWKTYRVLMPAAAGFRLRNETPVCGQCIRQIQTGKVDVMPGGENG